MSARWNLHESMERIRRAGLHPSEWSDALSFLADTIGGAGAVVFGTDRHVAHAPSSVSLQQAMAEYSRDGWYERDCRRSGVGVMLRNGIVTDQNLSDLSFTSDFYRDYLKRHKCEWFSGVGFKTGDDLWCLAMQRSAANGPFQNDEIERLKTLWRPLADAATMTRVLGDRHTLATVDALELVRHAAIVCDQKGGVVAFNAAARTILGSIYNSRTKNLKFVHAKSAYLFNKLLADTVDDKLTTSTTPTSADLVDNSGRALTVRSISLNTRDAFAFFNARILLLFKIQEDDLASRLKKYRLSAAEIKIAELLCQGVSVADIARVRRVKEESIRTQLKSIFSKTDVHSQAKLVALLTRSAGQAAKD